MDNIELVINIPEEEYRCVQITGCIGNKTQVSNAIFEGKSLPKGHGRLIDADELLKQSYRIDDSATLSTRDVVNTEEIDDAPTIIEADK